MKKMIVLLMMAALPVLIGCKSESRGEPAKTSTETAAKTETPVQQPTEPEIISKPSGVRYQELLLGTGAKAVDQMQVECHYTLWFADSTGLQKVERFQSSKDSNQPFQCQLGVRLLPAWSEGMIGMKEGGTRRIYIPWELGYGAQGGGPIPPKTNLIFEIEFLKAQQSIKDHSTTSTTSYSIKGTDNGYRWNKTPYSAKIGICADLARRIGRRDTQFYYDALEEFYNTTDPKWLNMTISEVASFVSLL